MFLVDNFTKKRSTNAVDATVTTNLPAAAIIVGAPTVTVTVLLENVNRNESKEVRNMHNAEVSCLFNARKMLVYKKPIVQSHTVQPYECSKGSIYLQLVRIRD